MLNTGAATKPSAHIIDNNVGYLVVNPYVYPSPKTPE